MSLIEKQGQIRVITYGNSTKILFKQFEQNIICCNIHTL